MKKDAIYWAGFFDGEGSIMISKEFNKDGHHRSPNYLVRLDVATTNKASMDALKDFAGCGWVIKRIFKKPNQRPAYYWGCKGNNALRLLKILLPYLRLKKPQALLAIKFQEKKTCRHGSKPLTKEDLEYREKIRAEMQALNAANSNKGKYWRDKNARKNIIRV